MHTSKKPIVAGLAALLMATGLAHAKVSEEEAAKLGTELHPFGAEKGANADGSIPEWNPKWKGLPPGLDYKGPGHTRPDPYEAEEPILIITAQNYQEHKENLGEGQQALFERYPEYRIVVYPTHRDFDVNDLIKERVKWNAVHTEVDNGVETLKHYNGHRVQTARALGIGVRTLTNKLRAYGYAPRTKAFSRAA